MEGLQRTKQILEAKEAGLIAAKQIRFRPQF